MRTFTKEEFWQECVRHKPDLERRDFNQRWDAYWTLAKMFGMPADIRG